MDETIHEALTVSTPALRILGAVALACGIVGVIVSFRESLLAAFFRLTLIGCSGAALLLMSGRITADETGIVVVRLLSRGRAQWSVTLDAEEASLRAHLLVLLPTVARGGASLFQNSTNSRGEIARYCHRDADALFASANRCVERRESLGLEGEGDVAGYFLGRVPGGRQR